MHYLDKMAKLKIEDIIFWIAIIWLIVWVIKELTKGKESATELLEKRFAKGEITKKQYSEMRKALRR